MACLAMVAIAFLLGIWVGVGWGSVMIQRKNREYDELLKDANRLYAAVEKAVQQKAM